MSALEGNKPQYIPANCQGEHRYFIAESGIVESEGKVCVVIICTSCGDSKLIEHHVTKDYTRNR